MRPLVLGAGGAKFPDLPAPGRAPRAPGGGAPPPFPADVTQLEGFLLLAPMLLFSFTAHELGHAWMARREGDMTAAMLGRITWNPLKHIDPWMTVLLPALLWFGSGGTFVFGGAKPVPVDGRNYKAGKWSDIRVSLAGVTMNVVVACGLVVGIIGLGVAGRLVPGLDDSLSLVQLMFAKGIEINLFLAAFNLIPLPPLDGSHVFKYLLPARWAIGYMRLGVVGFLALIMLLQTGVGERFLDLWTLPASAFTRGAVHLIRPFVIATEFTS